MAQPVAAAARPSGARRRKLTPVGATWMRGLYPPQMRMPQHTITAVVYFDALPAMEVIRAQFEKHIWPLYRFSSVVVNSYWVPVEGPMDVGYHFQEKEVNTEADVHAYVQSVMAVPLDETRPLWTVACLKSREGRSGFVIRIHHAISDGLGLMFAFLPLMECDDGEVLSKIPLPAALTGRRPAAASPRSAGARPARQGSWCCRVCTNIRMFFRGVLSILVLPHDAELKFNAKLADRKPYLTFSGRHVFTQMQPVPVEAIKAVRAKHGCTFNDAIMAALTGTFRRYGVENLGDPLLREQVPRGIECKCTMLLGLPRPIDPKDPSVSLRNNILTPIFKLPVNEADPVGRLKKAMAMCNDLKSMAYLAGIRMTTKLVAGIFPVKLMRNVTSEVISKCTCNVTNLPFPDVPVRFCGQEMKGVQAIFVNNIPQISMVSYNGALHWNMVSDPAFIPDPVAFGRHFTAEFALLASEARGGSE